MRKYTRPRHVRLVLETPLRHKRDAGIVGIDDFSFAALFANLLRRISMLTYFHTDIPLEVEDAGRDRFKEQFKKHKLPALRDAV